MSGHKNPSWFAGRCLAVIALLAQLTAPAALASGSSPDLASFFCAPSGALSAEARAEAESALAALLGDQPDHDRGNGHCSLCVLVHGVPLPDGQPALHIDVERRDAAPRLFETAFVHRPQGPPLGLRAPPPVSL